MKPLGSEAPFEITKRPASLADLPHTLAELLEVKNPYSGQHLFEPAETRERSFFHYEWENELWEADYLPPLQEYRISGYGRDADAWRKGRRLAPGVR